MPSVIHLATTFFHWALVCLVPAPLLALGHFWGLPVRVGCWTLHYWPCVFSSILGFILHCFAFPRILSALPWLSLWPVGPASIWPVLSPALAVGRIGVERVVATYGGLSSAWGW